MTTYYKPNLTTPHNKQQKLKKTNQVRKAQQNNNLLRQIKITTITLYLTI